MSSACLLHQIQYIQNSWLHSMTDFNKLRYRPVIEFLTLENVWPQQINKRMTVVYTVKMRHHMPWSSAGLLSFVKAEEAFKTRPGRGGRDVHPKLSARNCRATEHTVLQNHQLANGVSNSTGRVKWSCVNVCWWQNSVHDELLTHVPVPYFLAHWALCLSFELDYDICRDWPGSLTCKLFPHAVCTVRGYYYYYYYY